MPNITQILQDEIAGAAYQDKTPEEIADALNSETVTAARGEISRSDFVRDLPLVLVNMLSQTQNPDLAIAAKAKKWLAVFDVTVRPVDSINTGSQVVQGMLQQMKGDGFLSQEQFDLLTAKSVSKAHSLIGRGVTADDIHAALLPSLQADYDAAQEAIQAKAAELLKDNPDMTEREALERADQIINGHDWGHK